LIFLDFLTDFQECKKWAKDMAERIGERTEPCPTLMSILKKEEEKSFQRYLVFLPTR